MKNERKGIASFRVVEVREGIEFPIVDEAQFTKQDKENVLLDLNLMITRLAKHWNIDIEEFADRHNKIADLEMRIAKKTEERFKKELEEFNEWKARKLKKVKKSAEL